MYLEKVSGDVPTFRLLPLSMAQQDIWVAQALSPDSTWYNLAGYLDIHGPVDPSRLEAAIAKEVLNTDSLHLRFIATADGPRQYFVPVTSFSLTFVDLSQCEDPFSAAALWMQRDIKRKFDLEAGPLFRYALLQVADSRFFWYQCGHHLITDGFGSTLVQRRVAENYRVLSEGGAFDSLPPLSWVDFLADEAIYQASDRYLRDQHYWRSAFAVPPPAVTFSGRPPAWPSGLVVSRGVVPQATLVRLKAHGLQRGASLAAAMCAAIAIFLFRITGAQDIVLGVPVTGRVSPRMRRAAGLAANVVPLRLCVERRASVGDLLQQAGAKMREAVRHQRYGFVALRHDLGLAPDQPDIYGTLVNFIPINEDADFGGFHARKHHLQNWRVDDVMVTIDAGHPADDVVIEFSANHDNYDQTAVEQHLQRLLRILDLLADQPDQEIGCLPILTAQEYDHILDLAKVADSPKVHADVTTIFEVQAARTPDAIALVCDGKQLSFAALEADANRLARSLADQGIGPESIVALALPRSLDLVVASLAVLKAGAAFLLLDPDSASQRLKLMLRDSDAQMLLTTRQIATSLKSLHDGSLPKLLLDDPKLRSQLEAKLPIPLADAERTASLSSDRLAYLIYTSGSTAAPKGVSNTHAGLINRLVWQWATAPYGPHEVACAKTSVHFIDSITEILAPLLQGVKLVIATGAEARDPILLAALLKAQHVTRLTLVPSLLNVLLTMPTSLDSLRVCVCSGEALPRALANRFCEAVPRAVLWNYYGLSEASGDSIATRIEAGIGPVSIGRPIWNTQAYILDAALTPVPVGVVGELYLAGEGLARGYHRQPDLTRERFLRCPFEAPGAQMYRTGDLARWRPDGAIECLGRADSQVKIRGLRVEPGEIEGALMTLPSIAQAAVQAFEIGGETRLAAYLVPQQGRAIATAQSLRQLLAEQLPAQMIPSTFLTLDVLPLTSSGKLDRLALPPPASLASAHTKELKSEAATPTEKALVRIWHIILRTEPISRFDNFFDLGGDSLSAMQLVAQLRSTFAIELPLKKLFEVRTLAAMSEEIDLALLEGRQISHMPPIERTDQTGAAPLSYSQERMWIVQSFDPQTTAYNIGFAVRLTGNLDVHALSRAFDGVYQRHDALRCVVRAVEGVPLQQTEPWTSSILTTLDLRSRGYEAEALALKLARTEVSTPFDLARGPVFRLRLFTVAADTHILSVAFHHVAGDQWSIGILGRDLATLYNSYGRGEPIGLEAPSTRYRDFAFWQRNESMKAERDRQLNFWKKKLADLPSLDLPRDREPSSFLESNGTICVVAIPEKLALALERMARQASNTLFMTMLAAFAALLSKITGQTDISIGVPVAHRTLTSIEDVIGTFVNTLVFRLDLSGNPEFLEILDHVRSTALDAFANQDVPFEWLAQTLRRGRTSNHAPLLQVMFNFFNTPMHGITLDGLSWEPILLDRGGAQFEISMTVDHKILKSIYVEYNTSIFDLVTITRFINQYFLILDRVTTMPHSRLRSMSLLPPAPAAAVASLNEVASTASQGARQDMLFIDLFEQQVASTPLSVAISCNSQSFSYAYVNGRANAAARVLRGRGVGAGVLVAVCMDRTPLLLIALIAIQKAGGAYLPLDPHFPAARLSYMLCDSGTKLLLMAGSLPSGLNLPDTAEMLDMETLNCDERISAHNLSRRSLPEDTAYVIYTSGSTGRPKGVIVPHSALANLLQAMQQTPGLTARDVLAAVTTISFDIAALEMYLPLIVGARLELFPHDVTVDGAAMARGLAASEASVLQATPATWRMLIEAGWSGKAGFRALSGGETLTRDLADEILGRADELWNLYGPTESTIWSTLDKVDRGSAAVSIGRPIRNTQIHVLDAAGDPVEAGMVGEICIGGAGIADGYYGQAALTAERFIHDPFASSPGARLYRTGDLGCWGPDRKLYHRGRMDQQVKIRGFRIELEEIETTLRTHPAVLQAVAAISQASLADMRLVAYAVYRDRMAPTTTDLRSYLRHHLPDFMIPSMIISLETLPLTPNNKIDRAALPDPFRNDGQSDTRSDPAIGIEEIIANIWRKILKIDHISAEDNFFDLGGHSLLSLRVVAMLENEMGYELDPRALFFNNLRQVAALVGPKASVG